MPLPLTLDMRSSEPSVMEQSRKPGISPARVRVGLQEAGDIACADVAEMWERCRGGTGEM